MEELEREMSQQKSYNRLGIIFLDFVDEFKSYHHYILNYSQSIELLSQTRKTNVPLDQFLIKAKENPRCNLLSASDFLIMPIQRYF